MSGGLQQSTRKEYICLYDLRVYPNQTLSNLAIVLGNIIQGIITECKNDGVSLNDVKIRYDNTINQETNPDGITPAFLVTATRGIGDPENGKQWEAVK